jgi:hypothetical protein
LSLYFPFIEKVRLNDRHNQVIPRSIFHRVLNSQRINVRSGDNCAFPGCQQGNNPASAAEFEEFQALTICREKISARRNENNAPPSG